MSEFQQYRRSNNVEKNILSADRRQTLFSWKYSAAKDLPSHSKDSGDMKEQRIPCKKNVTTHLADRISKIGLYEQSVTLIRDFDRSRVRLFPLFRACPR